MSLPFALVSDLHLEASNLDLSLGGARLLAAVGDIYAPSSRMQKGDEHPAVQWLARKAPADMPVLFVPGNHDYEGNKVFDALDIMRETAKGTQVHVLWNEAFDFEGVRFLGTPLFTDFALQHPINPGDMKKPMNCDMARSFDERGQPLSGEWMARQHRIARDFLARELDRDPRIPKVVLTHWCPTTKALENNDKHEKDCAYWISPCEDLAAKATLWCHGHLHETVDVRVGQSKKRGRIVSNPRGWIKFFNMATNNNFVQPRILTV